MLHTDEVSDPPLRSPAQTLAGTSQSPALAEEESSAHIPGLPKAWENTGERESSDLQEAEGLCDLLQVPQPKHPSTHLTPPSLLTDTPDFDATPTPPPNLLPSEPSPPTGLGSQFPGLTPTPVPQHRNSAGVYVSEHVTGRGISRSVPEESHKTALWL